MTKSKKELADMFGVDDLGDITGDGDELFEEYLSFEADFASEPDLQPYADQEEN
jgi:hypothetical protein